MLVLALQGSLKRGGHGEIGARQFAQEGLNAIGTANLRRLDQLASAAHRQAFIIQAVLGA